jgi:hypothetical protein
MIKCFAFLFLLFLIGCTSAKITSRAFPFNPVAYTFDLDIDSARTLFRNSYFRYHNAMGFDLQWKDFEESVKGSSSGERRVVQQRSNGELTAYMILTVDSSIIYQRSDGKALPYWMECRMHFVPIEKHKVEIVIEVLSAWVILGKQLLPGAPHFVKNDKIRNVVPTTIEEYKLLLCFGKGLGIYEQMPVLKTE